MRALCRVSIYAVGRRVLGSSGSEDSPVQTSVMEVRRPPCAAEAGPTPCKAAAHRPSRHTQAVAGYDSMSLFRRQRLAEDNGIVGHLMFMLLCATVLSHASQVVIGNWLDPFVLNAPEQGKWGPLRTQIHTSTHSRMPRD